RGASWKHSAVAPRVTGCPSMLTSPASGASNPASIRSRVVFPPPEGPTMTVMDPVGTSRLTSSRALTCPNVRVTPSMRSDTVVSAPAPAEQAGYRSEGPVDHRDDQRASCSGGEIGDVQAKTQQVGDPLRKKKDHGIDHQQEQPEGDDGQRQSDELEHRFHRGVEHHDDGGHTEEDQDGVIFTIGVERLYRGGDGDT